MKIKSYRVILFFSLVLLFLNACGDDMNIDPSNPTISMTGTAGDTLRVVPNQQIIFTITAVKGSVDLNGLEVREGDTKAAINRIVFKGSAVGGNPILLLGNDRQGFTGELKVTAPAKDTVVTISVIVSDANNVTVKETRIVKTKTLPPVVTYLGTPLVDGAQPGQVYDFPFSVSRGFGKLSLLEVKENGITLSDITRLSFDNIAFNTNPESILPNLQAGFTNKKIGVKINNQTGRSTYTFIFTDELGASAQFTVNVNVGTKLDLTKLGALLNANGPGGTGGLDLDTGNSMGSQDTLAEIKDEGIDLSLPLASNWLQKISAVNGAELKRIIQVIEFDDIVVKEQILNLWNGGFPVNGATPKVLKGDLFAVKKGDRYFFLQVANIVVTPADNSDKYEVNIKW
ncbi:MAG: hypothetical protein IPN29_13100 [Saprospiraceae bacterium]|nr:hypothetical protein [Saprospiraceae bacterium]